MATYYNEDVIPSLIPNTTMYKRFRDGVPTIYGITPNEGYVLHNNVRDYTITDPDTMEETRHLGYGRGTSTVSASYDFTPVVITDEYGVSFTAYGANELAARLESEVPADQIFGGGNNDHEVM